MGTLQEALDAAQPSLLPSALQQLKLGTMLSPLKRTFASLLVPGTVIDLTAIDADGEDAGDENPNRLAAAKVTTLRVTQGAVSGLLAGGTDAIQAFLDLSGPGSATFDIVVKATELNVGTDGNGGTNVTIASVADGVDNGSNGGASVTQSGIAVTLHYVSGQTTVADMQRAIAAFGAEPDALIELKTASTNPSYILLVGDDDFGATNLAGGAAMIPATLDLGTLGSGELDSVVQYNGTGIFSGNGVRVALLPDGLAAGSFTEEGEDATATVVFHYLAATTTVTQFETALAVYDADGLITLDTAGTGANILPNLDATMVGAYVVSDAGATALTPSAVICGIAKLSDDGTTLTFLESVGGLVITYIPRSADTSANFPAQ
jgi:hypothetical protein